MEVAAVRHERRGITSELAAGKRFGKFAPEKEKAVRVPNVKEDKALQMLKEAWKGYNYDRFNYDVALGAIGKLEYSAKDVEKFSIALIGLQNEEHFSQKLHFFQKAGLFLSALINNCKDTDFVIHTQHLIKGIGELGLMNTKNIIVNGNAGDNVGQEMEGGSIMINGNVGKTAGNFMRGGSITVNGDADQYLGFYMQSGTITVTGNAGEDVGLSMKGGEIHLLGDYESISNDIEGGKIYHKGKLIWSK